MQQLTATDLAAWLARDDGAGAPVLLDVREPWELAICRLPDSQHIPLREVPSRLAEIDRSRPIVCVCHHGGRSAHAAAFLQHHGFSPVYNLVGGIDAWALQVDADCPRY